MLSNLTTFEFVLLFIAVYICVFGLVNRICKCVENRAYAKAIAVMSATNSIPPFPDLGKAMESLKKAAEATGVVARKENHNDSGTV